MLFFVVASFVFQIGIWAWIWKGFKAARRIESDADREPEPVSVIVAARDEAENLPTLLTHLRRQDAKAFEVILVNDRSSDGTGDILEAESPRWNREGRTFRIVSITDNAENTLPGKKGALTAGIDAAQNERLLFTDADGQPGRQWVSRTGAMATNVPDGLFVGYGPTIKRPGWLNRFVRYETVHTATLAAAAIGHGKAWHAVGRNLSYTKSLFARVGGFESHAASLSGDDDLFVQQASREPDVPICYLFDPETHVPSEGPDSRKAFFRQRRRHTSAGKQYGAGILTALGIHHTTNLALWFGALFLHLASGNPAGWGFLAFKLLIQRGALQEAMKAFRAEGDLSLAQPVLDPCLSLYQMFAAILGSLPAPERWS